MSMSFSPRQSSSADAGWLGCPPPASSHSAPHRSVAAVVRHAFAHSERAVPPQTAMPLQHAAANASTPSAAIAAAAEQSLLSEALDALPTRCRHVFSLRMIGGLTQREIAARLQLSSTAVEEQMDRAIRSCTLFLRQREAGTGGRSTRGNSGPAAARLREAGVWLARRDRGLTAAETEGMLEWLSLGPDNEEAFAELERTSERFGRLDVGADDAVQVPERKGTRQHFWWLAGVGLALCVLFVLARI